MTGQRIGATSGTTASEFARSITQFKGFPGAILEKVWGRQLYGYGESGKIGDATGSGMAGIAEFMVYSTMLGSVALYLKAYLKGKRITMPTSGEEGANLFLAAFLQGGGAGLYGDFLLGEARDRYGHSALESLAGPSAGMFTDMFSGLKKVSKAPFDYMFDRMKEGDSNYGAAFFAMKNNAPFVNLFYTRLALDYMFLYRLQEAFAPGSLKRSENNLKKGMNQTFALPPSENYRAEDLTTEDIGNLLNPL
jgi:hypothetical protein